MGRQTFINKSIAKDAKKLFYRSEKVEAPRVADSFRESLIHLKPVFARHGQQKERKERR